MPSDVRFRNKEDFNEEYSGFMAQLRRYGRSKVAMVLYTKELQKRLDAEGIPILVISLHPGTINTGTSIHPIYHITAVLINW